MRHEAAVQVRGKHLIGEHVLVRERPVRRDLTLRYVRIGEILGRVGFGLLVIPSVHPAFGAGRLSCAVAGGKEGGGVVTRIPAAPEIAGLYGNLVALRVVTVGCRQRARIAHEEVVKRPVLLNDENNVLDGRRKRRPPCVTLTVRRLRAALRRTAKRQLKVTGGREQAAIARKRATVAFVDAPRHGSSRGADYLEGKRRTLGGFTFMGKHRFDAAALWSALFLLAGCSATSAPSLPVPGARETLSR